MLWALCLMVSCGTLRRVPPVPPTVSSAGIPQQMVELTSMTQQPATAAPVAEDVQQPAVTPAVPVVEETWAGRVCRGLDSLCAQPLFETTQLGMYIYDLTEGRPLYARNAIQRLRPASCQKLVTSIAALHYLGGDYQFRKKCSERMEHMLSGGTTLLYVSHDIDSVKQLCDHVLWLDHGEVLMSGGPDTVCDAYARRLDKVYSFRRKLEEDREQLERGDHVDYLVVGAGLFGSVFAHEAKKAGKKVAVIEKRDHIGGNIYTEKVNGIHVHKYGAHIFHTSDRKVWSYINRYAEFNQYINAPVARYKDELYNLPFNMNTFSRMWGVVTPEEARAKIQEQISQLNITEPKNLEEQALSLVGRDVYEKLVKDYTEKQWGRDCKDLPAFIIRRLPMRFTYDNNYFNDRYQGIPIGGYTQIVEKLLAGVPTLLGTSWQEYAKAHPDSYDKLIFTGPIDEYFDYALGKLQYRTVRFETEVLETDNYQGNAVVNYTGHEVHG